MNENIPQLATIRITCNGITGTAVLFFPGIDLDYVYVFTAKHCLAGKKFDKEFSQKDIVLDKIFNAENGTYCQYALVETDIVIVSADQEDMALLILPKQRIVDLTGRDFICQIIDTNSELPNYIIRGFSNFTLQKADRQIPLCFVEDQKDNNKIFLLKSDENFDTYEQKAIDNLEGLSGSGAYAIHKDNIYLAGIVHTFDDDNVFSVTKILAFNHLIPSDKFSLILPVKPEINESVLGTFQKMDKNRGDINNRTKDTVGTIHIPRDTKGIIKLLSDSRFAIIHGKPGVGKSALAKSVVTELRLQGQSAVLTFTPEQLYCQTLEEALVKAGYTAGFEQIVNSPLSGGRVLVWIESFEKLLESGFEGAFGDLLSLLKKRTQLSLVVTMRDYLLQKFKINYHYELPEADIFYTVHDFNETETNNIRDLIPSIAPLLHNPKIHHLLRNPYYMDKAVRIIPHLLVEEHLDEVKFKRLMWEHIIENGNQARGAVFSEICLKRALEMSLYTGYKGAPEIIDNLVRDNILQIEDSELANRYGPSHDILEDWALIRHIKQMQQDSETPQGVITSLENSPAIKRAFRLWIDEFFRQEPTSSILFVRQILTDASIDDSWKDELIIATLRSNHANTLFEVLSETLLENKGMMLRHVIQLLKTGCKTIDNKNSDFKHLLPVGSGWDATINFVHDSLDVILSFETFEFLYLSVIEDWSQQLPDFNPENLPPGAANAAILLEDFLYRYQDKKISDYRKGRHDRSYLKRYISILFKLTASAKNLVEQIIIAAENINITNERWSNKEVLESVRNYATEGVMADQLCKYFPDRVINIANEEWKAEERVHRPGSIMSMIVREPDISDFGLNEDLKNDYDFSSAYQSFLYWMFLYHPEKALNFFIPFLNKAIETNYQILSPLKDETEPVTINFEDGANQSYFGSYEYWVMFRGINTRNKLLASLLMALEKGLLDLADSGQGNYILVRSYISRLIRESNNVATLGLISSVLQAHPDLLDEISVSLLGIPQFYVWDSTRSNSEMIDLDNYNDDPFQKQERIVANCRKHRHKYYQGLIGFVPNYMFHYSSQNELLYKLVDAMWDAAPKSDELWRKFLFDMDARKYTFQPISQPGYENYVQLIPGYDEGVKEMMVDYKKSGFFPSSLSSMWAKQIFDGKEVKDNTYQTWKNIYQSLQENAAKKDRFMTYPGTMATIGIQNFLDNLTSDELKWCQNTLLAHGEEHLKPRDLLSFGKNVMDENPPLMGLSYIFKSNPDKSIELKTKKLIFRLLISRIEERPKVHLDAGIATELFRSRPEFATACWFGLLEYINKSKASNAAEDQRRQEVIADFGFNDPERTSKADEKWRKSLINSVVSGKIEAPGIVDTELDVRTHWFQDDALRIIPTNTSNEQQQAFVKGLLANHLSYISDRRQQRKYDFHDSRHAFKFFYSHYLLNQPQEIATQLFVELLNKTGLTDADIDQKQVNEFIYEIVKEHIRAVNSGSSVSNFWALWERLRIWMIETKKPIFFPLFLMDLDWNENSEKWFVLDGKNQYYKDFIENYGFNLINVSLKFLAGIAFEQFMPDSISWVAVMLTSPNADQTDLAIADKFVRKAFYKYGSSIKKNSSIRTYFMYVLDYLIGKGSSVAFMMKEELIQYK